MNLKEYQQILLSLQGFIPSTRLQGPITGLIIDAERKELIAVRNEGGIVYPVSELGTNQSVVVRAEDVDRLLKFEKPEWGGLKVGDGKAVIQVGRNRLTIPVESKPTSVIPPLEIVEGASISEEFLSKLRQISVFMCTDDRQLNVYGVFVGNNALYASDNKGAVRIYCTIPDGLKNTFLPFFCVNSLVKSIDVVMAKCFQNYLVFKQRSGVVRYFALLGAKFPNMDRIFDQVESEPGIDMFPLVDPAELQVFSNISYADDLSSILSVVVEGSLMHLTSQSARTSSAAVEHEIPLEDPIQSSVRFVVDINRFLAGLKDYHYLRVCKDFVVMYGRENPEVVYVVLKMTRA